MYRNPTFGLRSSNAIEPERHVIAEGYDSEMKFLFNAYTNPNTNPKILMACILTLNDRHDDFESFSAPVFCDGTIFFWALKPSDS